MNRIDSYDFGQIVINGKEYASDVIIFPDRIKDNWFRKVGHKLSLEDIAEVVAEKPEVLVIGTGAAGVMKVPPEVEKAIKDKGIKLIAERTAKACQTYNQICQSQRAVAALHLTC